MPAVEEGPWESGSSSAVASWAGKPENGDATARIFPVPWENSTGHPATMTDATIEHAATRTMDRILCERPFVRTMASDGLNGF